MRFCLKKNNIRQDGGKGKWSKEGETTKRTKNLIPFFPFLPFLPKTYSIFNAFTGFISADFIL
jgi:hypothetical protein